MKYYLYLLTLAISASSCATENVTDEVYVLSSKLYLTNKDGVCFLRTKAAEFVLKPTPPCFFLINSEKKPQYYSYRDVNTDAVLIVTGTSVTNDIRRELGLRKDVVCGMVSQGVFIKGGSVSVSESVLEGGVLCRDSGSDEKNYWFFAHNK